MSKNGLFILDIVQVSTFIYIQSREELTIEGDWSQAIVDTGNLKPTTTGLRGSICADKQHNLYLLLPGNHDASLNIFRSPITMRDLTFQLVWSADGFDGEPLYDSDRLANDDGLSIFTRWQKNVAGEKDVVVLNFDLNS